MSASEDKSRQRAEAAPRAQGLDDIPTCGSSPLRRLLFVVNGFREVAHDIRHRRRDRAAMRTPTDARR